MEIKTDKRQLLNMIVIIVLFAGVMFIPMTVGDYAGWYLIWPLMGYLGFEFFRPGVRAARINGEYLEVEFRQMLRRRVKQYRILDCVLVLDGYETLYRGGYRVPVATIEIIENGRWKNDLGSGSGFKVLELYAFLYAFNDTKIALGG